MYESLNQNLKEENLMLRNNFQKEQQARIGLEHNQQEY